MNFDGELLDQLGQPHDVCTADDLIGDEHHFGATGRHDAGLLNGCCAEAHSPTT